MKTSGLVRLQSRRSAPTAIEQINTRVVNTTGSSLLPRSGNAGRTMQSRNGSASVHGRVGGGFEILEEPQHGCVRKRDELRQQHAGDTLAGIDPEIRVAESCP